MPEPLFTGVLTALVTPFRDGAVDETAVLALAERQILHGVDGLVAASIAGEAPTLSHPEHRRVIELAVQAAGGQIPVIAGIGSNNTATGLEHLAFAASVGCSGVLAVAPYYVRPSQDGLLQHFTTLSQASALPILIHDCPARTRVDLSVETLALLSRLPNIEGVVDATGDLGRASLIRAACSPGFGLWSGDDATTLGLMAHGGRGGLSLTANVAPKSVSAFMTHCLDGEWDRARRAQDRMIHLHQALAADEPAAAKFGLSRMGGLCGVETRLPVLPAPPETWGRVMDAMSEAADVMFGGANPAPPSRVKTPAQTT